MRIRKLILYTGVCCFYLGLTGLDAIQTQASEIHVMPESNDIPLEQARLLIAADSSDDKQVIDTEKASGDSSIPEDEQTKAKEKPSSNGNTERLTTFEPTEKVKADQAVDFPYDI